MRVQTERLSMKDSNSKSNRAKQLPLLDASVRQPHPDRNQRPERHPTPRIPKSGRGKRTESYNKLAKESAQIHDGRDVTEQTECNKQVANQGHIPADLVWKYFEGEICEALFEVQAEIETPPNNLSENPTHRGQEEK
jgi:hypothetical protein